MSLGEGTEYPRRDMDFLPLFKKWDLSTFSERRRYVLQYLTIGESIEEILKKDPHALEEKVQIEDLFRTACLPPLISFKYCASWMQKN
jgi:hypothetical protein